VFFLGAALFVCGFWVVFGIFCVSFWGSVRFVGVVWCFRSSVLCIKFFFSLLDGCVLPSMAAFLLFCFVCLLFMIYVCGGLFFWFFVCIFVCCTCL